jgi:hypothetical protein
LTSATAIDWGRVPVKTDGHVKNPPSPSPVSAWKVFDPKFATTTSSFPSPVKSATASDVGDCPTLYDAGIAAPPSPSPM